LAKRVLILCTGNSCRSQLAEAMINHDLAGKWIAFSAGTQPVGYVHPLARKVLEEIGIHHDGESKSVDHFRGETFDAVITVCDDANENCPVWFGKGNRVHIGFPDPARVDGTETEKLNAFRRVRDDIRRQIPTFLISGQTVDVAQE
jgi:arsenate reductase (thioredoxin)